MSPNDDRFGGASGAAVQAGPQGTTRLAQALEEYRELLDAGSPPDRVAFLARYAGMTDELAECLSGLEFVHAVAPALSGAAAESAAGVGVDARMEPGVPLGDFRLIREVGRGGMGIVYEAVQISLGRRVALKVLPFAATMDPRQLQRFHNEARAAASLDHPHIVHVHAVGQERGVHYYAMQFIDGRTLADFIAQQCGSASPQPAVAYPVEPAADTAAVAAAPTEPALHDRAYFRRVAEWGTQAAEALEHAHQLGVIHRDIKPANLMIDGRGRLWVADFGLARTAADSGLTMSGDLVGTLRYMSPEQALAQRGLVDHRADVYSLGGTLYELLTLLPAFGGQDRQELLRQIAFEEPRRLRRLNRAVPAELETIVLKAMEKRAPDRYATAKELADDLRRYLADVPIRAKRPSLGQRLGRWSRRNRPLVVSLLLTLVAAVVALAVSTVALWRANVQEGDALAKTTAALTEKEAALARAQARTLFARQAADDFYTQVAQEWLEDTPRMQAAQREFLLKALQLYQELAREQGDDEGVRYETARAYARVGQIHFKLGEHAKAEAALGEAIERFQGLADVEPDKADYRRRLAGGLNDLALVYRQTGREAEGERAEGRAIDMMESLSRDIPGERSYRNLLAGTLVNKAIRQHGAGHSQDAEQTGRRAVELLKSLLADDPKETSYRQRMAAATLPLGLALVDNGKSEEAEHLYKDAVGLMDRLPADALIDGPAWFETAANVRCNLGQLLGRAGRHKEAEPVLRQAAGLLDRLAREYPSVGSYRHALAETVHNLALLLEQTRRLVESEKAYRHELALLEQLAAEQPEVPGFLNQLAGAYDHLDVFLRQARKSAEADELALKSVTVWQRRVAQSPAVAEYRQQLARRSFNAGNILKAAQQLPAAEQAYQRALEHGQGLAREFPEAAVYRDDLSRFHNNYGMFLLDTDRLKEAAEQWRQALKWNPKHAGAQKNLDRLLAQHPEIDSR